MAVSGMTTTQLVVETITLTLSSLRECAAPVVAELPVLQRVSAPIPTKDLETVSETSATGILLIQLDVVTMIPKNSKLQLCAVHAREAALTPNWEDPTKLEIAATGTQDSQIPAEIGTLKPSRLLIDAVPVMEVLEPLLSIRSVGTPTKVLEISLGTDATGMSATQDTAEATTPTSSVPTTCAALAAVDQADPATTPTKVPVISLVTSANGTMPTQTHAETTTPKISPLTICAASAVAVPAPTETGPSPCLPNSRRSTEEPAATPPTLPSEAPFSLPCSAPTSPSRERHLTSSKPESSLLSERANHFRIYLKFPKRLQLIS